MTETLYDTQNKDIIPAMGRDIRLAAIEGSQPQACTNMLSYSALKFVLWKRSFKLLSLYGIIPFLSLGLMATTFVIYLCFIIYVLLDCGKTKFIQNLVPSVFL